MEKKDTRVALRVAPTEDEILRAAEYALGTGWGDAYEKELRAIVEERQINNMIRTLRELEKELNIQKKSFLGQDEQCSRSGQRIIGMGTNQAVAEAPPWLARQIHEK